MNGEAHLLHEAIEVFFAYLDRSEGSVPLPSFAWSGGGLHILDHDIGEWQDGEQVGNHPCFGLPAAARRGRYPLLAMEPPGPSHRSARLHGVFDMIRRFDHQVQDGLVCAHHTEPLKLGPWITPYDQQLLVRFLL